MLTTDLQRHDVVIGTFAPERTDNLREDAARWIGWRGRWTVAWEIERGEYEGEWAMFSMEMDLQCPKFWVPLRDLKDVTEE